jgi:hypothetical protein
MDYIDWPTISEALKGLPLEWTEERLVKICRQTRAPLKFLRVAERGSKPLWKKNEIIRFFHQRLRKQAPELAIEIERRLNAPITPSKKTKASAQ